MNEFNLTAQEPPPPLQRATQLIYWEALVGHTILAAIDCPSGKFECDVLIVTETHCWMALESESDGCDESFVRIIGSGYSPISLTINDYASPQQLLHIGVISPGECSRLETISAEENKRRATLRAQQLRAELARLEGGST